MTTYSQHMLRARMHQAKSIHYGDSRGLEQLQIYHLLISWGLQMGAECTHLNNGMLSLNSWKFRSIDLLCAEVLVWGTWIYDSVKYPLTLSAKMTSYYWWINIWGQVLMLRWVHSQAFTGLIIIDDWLNDSDWELTWLAVLICSSRDNTEMKPLQVSPVVSLWTWELSHLSFCLPAYLLFQLSRLLCLLEECLLFVCEECGQFLVSVFLNRW